MNSLEDPNGFKTAQGSPSLNYASTLLGRLDARAGAGLLPRLILSGALLFALIVPTVQSSVRIRRVDKSAFRAGGERHETALGRWLPTAKVLSDGSADPYGAGHWFPTPPFVLMCLVPFEKMSYAAAGIVWGILKAGGFLVAMGALVRQMKRSGISPPLGVLLMAGVFGIRPIISDLQHANLNIFMMIWVSLAWVCHLRGSDISAGLFTALAIVTKVTPALLLVYFIYKRRWSIALGATIGLVLLVVVIPGLYAGFGEAWTMHQNWYRMLVAPYAEEGWVTLEIANQSLYGVLVRLLSNAGLLSIELMPVDQAMAVGMEDMARPITAAGKLLRPTLTLLLLFSLAWFCRKRRGTSTAMRPWLEYSLVLLAMLLMGERTWKHHATTLPIVYLTLWYSLTCESWATRFRGWCVAALAGQFVLLVIGGEGFFGDNLADKMLDGGFFCWGVLLAAIQTAVMLSRMPVKPELPATASAGYSSPP